MIDKCKGRSRQIQEPYLFATIKPSEPGIFDQKTLRRFLCALMHFLFPQEKHADNCAKAILNPPLLNEDKRSVSFGPPHEDVRNGRFCVIIFFQLLKPMMRGLSRDKLALIRFSKSLAQTNIACPVLLIPPDQVAHITARIAVAAL